MEKSKWNFQGIKGAWHATGPPRGGPHKPDFWAVYMYIYYKLKLEIFHHLFNWKLIF